MKEEEVKGVSIFPNANIDQGGMEAALKALKIDQEIKDDNLTHWQQNKSFRYYGGLVYQGIKFMNLSEILGWKSSVNYVEYKNQSCGAVVIVGNGAD